MARAQGRRLIEQTEPWRLPGGFAAQTSGAPSTVAVVSHPNVVLHNHLIYVRLAERGWAMKLIVPNRWQDEYSPGGYVPQPVQGLVGTFARVRIARPGAIQRHVYVTRPTAWLQRWRPA